MIKNWTNEDFIYDIAVFHNAKLKLTSFIMITTVIKSNNSISHIYISRSCIKNIPKLSSQPGILADPVNFLPPQNQIIFKIQLLKISIK